ncbi:LPS O-antigen chain length determinant protein WzzB [Pseudomonas japonica]|uniref:Chain length determinant protein (Polysaccharide antigen chain regulator) n=1 Tax=Pseudomonas japonica TaxID=256466 RepID=A0A239HGQ0_9PSED|nr:Wzz/FepE/Etk N-terminal domain-containing protein [Pseudomonas japonica]SNS79434.1 chain length determinant protein (polysaccharide antigen chain regulator) [Pseudomonas japonica]
MRDNRERLSITEEVDLIELIERLWRRKLLIFGTALTVLIAAVAYVFLATPIYQAKVFVQAPTQNDIANLNYGRSEGQGGLGVLTVKEVYDTYLRNLLSESLRRKFFREVYLPSLDGKVTDRGQDELYARYVKALRVTVAGKDTPDRYSITADLPDAQQAVKWVTLYARMAGDLAKQEVLKDARSDALVKAGNLEQEIASVQETARKRREDQIVQLREALAVARSIGLEKPPIISGNLSTEVSARMDGSLTYMRGSKALEAEIENLEKRPSDDPFISGLRAQQAGLAFFRSLDVPAESITVYRLDGDVELPDKPIEPRKLLIIVAAAVLGLLLGCIAAIIANLLRGRVRVGPGA